MNEKPYHVISFDTRNYAWFRLFPVGIPRTSATSPRLNAAHKGSWQ